MGLLRSAAIWLVALFGAALVLPVVAVAIPFFLAAFVTRLATRKARVEQPARWTRFVQYEPVIGWRPRPHLDLYAQADDVFHLTTGRDGWRGNVPVEEADIVVFGDSFAFGHGAADEAMYTQFCGGLRVKPIGSDGYDTVQALLWMERLAPRLAGKLVVLFVYYGNDLWDNLEPSTGRYRKPFLRQIGSNGGWETVTEHVSPEPWPFATSRSDNARLADICCPSHLAERAYSACDALIGRAEGLCRQIGARLAVVGIPDRVQLTRRGRAQLARLAPHDLAFDADRPDKIIQESCHRRGVTFVPLKAHLRARHHLLQDIHWRTSGHKRVGAILRRLHEGTGT